MQNQSPSDLSLFQRIQQGDERAFRLLFDRYFQLLVGVAFNFLKDLNTAKDIVQEVFLNIWRKRESLSAPSNLGAYLKRATINRSINYIKSRKSTVDVTEQFSLQSKAPDANQVLEASDLEQVIQQALASLPERCRMVFVMKRIEGKSLKEIAEALDISPKTAENQITKALKILKEAVKPHVDKKIK